MDRSEIEAKLERRFGMGTRPELRKALYQRLADLIEAEGEPALIVIAGCAQDAEGKRQPDRYFCAVIIRRLMERGFLGGAEL